MQIDSYLDRIGKPYVIFLLIAHILYIVTYLGLLSNNETYIKTLNIALQTFIVVFLLIRFNPLRKKYEVKPVDVEIIFGSAFLLGTNLISVELSWLFKPVLDKITGFGNQAKAEVNNVKQSIRDTNKTGNGTSNGNSKPLSVTVESLPPK